MKKIYIYDEYDEKDNNTEIYNNYDNYDKFGFQIFNLIYGVYLYNLYNENDNYNDNYNDNDDNNKCKIYYIYNKLNDTPLIHKIYNDIKTKINFICYDDFYELNQNVKPHNDIITIVFDINTLNNFPKYEELYDNTKFKNAINLTYKMYDTFNDDDKNIFRNFNEKLVTDNRLFKLKNINYSIISIVYGNKLSYINKSKNDEIILNTPNYYLNMIFNTLSLTNIGF